MALELNKLHQDEFIEDYKRLLKSLDGWSDLRNFALVEAKAIVLKENIKNYIHATESKKHKASFDNNKIFIVHGHYERWRRDTGRFFWSSFYSLQ